MKRITHLIQSHIQGKKVLGLFILTNAVYIVMLGYTIPKTMNFSKGLNLLDMMPTGYDLNYVQELLGTLGESGREVYLTYQLAVDMIYPFLFGVSYCLILGFFLDKLNKLQAPYVYACLLPLLAGFSDYMENFGIIHMLHHYPNLTETMVTFTNTCTVLKSVLTSVYFVVLVVVLIILGIEFVKSKRS